MSNYRELWEEFHGVSIPKGWDIHHIDSNHNNSILGNLLAYPRSAHIRLHEQKGEVNSANLLRCGKAVKGIANPMSEESVRKKSGDSISRFWEGLSEEDRAEKGRIEQQKFIKFYRENPEAYREQSIKRWEAPTDKMNEAKSRLNQKLLCCSYCHSEVSLGTFSRFHGDKCKQRSKINDLA